MSELTNYVHERDLRGLRDWLTETGSLEIAEELGRAEPEYRALAFRLLPKERALPVFELLDSSLQQELLVSLREPNIREILEDMEPDDRARLLDEMPPKIAKRLLEGLSLNERRLTSMLLGYPEDTVGRIMSPEFVDLQASMTAADAIDKVRSSGRNVEAIHTLPVTDAAGTLLQVIGLGDLVLANPGQPVGELASNEIYSVEADEDQETASLLLLDTGWPALPVVDSERHLVGVLTFDDAMEVLQASDTEQILRSGGSEPLHAPYMSVSILYLTRSRAVWLLILGLAATLTVNVLGYFEAALQSAIRLSLFIPLLIGIGGNVGAQSATIVIRAMALGEVRLSDFIAVILREIRVGALLGATTAAIAFLPVMVFFEARIALILSLSLMCNAVLAAFAGSVLPMAARKTGVDPAVVSAPVITTLVDSAGLVIYFLFAKAILNI